MCWFHCHCLQRPAGGCPGEAKGPPREARVRCNCATHSLILSLDCVLDSSTYRFKAFRAMLRHPESTTARGKSRLSVRGSAAPRPPARSAPRFSSLCLLRIIRFLLLTTATAATTTTTTTITTTTTTSTTTTTNNNTSRGNNTVADLGPALHLLVPALLRLLHALHLGQGLRLSNHDYFHMVKLLFIYY